MNQTSLHLKIHYSNTLQSNHNQMKSCSDNFTSTMNSKNKQNYTNSVHVDQEGCLELNPMLYDDFVIKDNFHVDFSACQPSAEFDNLFHVQQTETPNFLYE